MSAQQKSTEQSDKYRSYLVRLWQAPSDTSWRASVQSVRTGETRLFGNFENLIAFLQGQLRWETVRSPEYEFTEEQNHRFERLAQTLRYFALIFGLFGLLNAIRGTIQLIQGSSTLTNNVIHIGAGILVIGLAYFVSRPLESLKRITTTEGEDITALMAALTELNKVHGLYSIVLLIFTLSSLYALLAALIG